MTCARGHRSSASRRRRAGKRRGSSDGRTKQQGARGAGAAVKRSRSASAAGDDGTPKRARKSASGAKDDKEIKWKTLKHSGLIFPPEYVRHGVPLLYDGVPVPASDEPSTTTLTAEQEEVATLFAAMLETDYAKKDIFLNNFWADFKQVLGKGHMIKDLKKCDFRDIYNHLQAQREDKKALSKEVRLHVLTIAAVLAVSRAMVLPSRALMPAPGSQRASAGQRQGEGGARGARAALQDRRHRWARRADGQLPRRAARPLPRPRRASEDGQAEEADLPARHHDQHRQGRAHPRAPLSGPAVRMRSAGAR